jgi:hypothetical protein
MKPGDLVKRLNDWVKHNPWMSKVLETEIGIITKTWSTTRNDKLVLVLWPNSGLRTEHTNDLECV